ncbi:MAG: Mpv17/PMP22 family protein [Verrucomicrobiaceae bacterium]|nr:Mpv17/PMP22 family protein [Verrucomicrobiaceae bacterium]
MPDSSPATPGILSSISSVFRQNRVPCVLLNIVVVLLVGSYYQLPAVADAWQSIGELKIRWSYFFSLCSTILAAVLLPSFVQWLLGTLPQADRMRRIGLLALFWGYRGMEIDLFYRLQGYLFGTGNDARTLITKVAVDQFIMSPLWFVPTLLIAMRWVDMGGSWARTRATLDRSFWTRTCPTVLITNWLVWIPTLALVYSLPPALQFPLFSVVMCFFILIVTVLARQQTAE